MVLIETRRQTLTTTSRLCLALTPAMKQSLQLMAWRNHQITRFVRDLLPIIRFLMCDIRNTRAPHRYAIDFPFSSGMAQIGRINHFMRI